MSKTVGLLALFALCALLRVAESQLSTTPTCICTLEYAPVCAEGKTYGNACAARCAGYKEGDWVVGECGKCICTKEYRPVCAKGKTFGNKCLARCQGYLKYTQGACPKPCACTREYNPVCSDGKTYSTACTAKCAGRKTWVKGKCGKGAKCNCPKIRAPVCANGKKTFGNSCVAKCYGYLSFTKGECTPPPIECDAGSSIAKCSEDVCTNSDSPCATNPTVGCIINPCSSATYLGTKLKGLQCKPIYVNKYSNKVEKNCNKPLPPLLCDAGSPQAKCKGDPCELTTAPCKGDDRYVCLGNSCGTLTYLGTKLDNAVCTAIFVDPLKRKVVKSCIPAQG